MQNVERYVVEKEFLNDIYANIHRYAEPDLLELIIDMRGEGWSDFEIARKAAASISGYSGWGVREITQLIRIITHGSNSPLQKLYKDTKRYGDVEKFCEWEDAREN